MANVGRFSLLSSFPRDEKTQESVLNRPFLKTQLKKIFVKNVVFISFQFDEKLDPIFSRNIFASQGDYWRNTRKELSPAFTQAKVYKKRLESVKIRNITTKKYFFPIDQLQPMYSIIHESAVKMLQFIDSHVGTDKSKTINTKDVSKNYFLLTLYRREIYSFSF